MRKSFSPMFWFPRSSGLGRLGKTHSQECFYRHKITQNNLSNYFQNICHCLFLLFSFLFLFSSSSSSLSTLFFPSSFFSFLHCIYLANKAIKFDSGNFPHFSLIDIATMALRLHLEVHYLLTKPTKSQLKL